MKYWFGSVPNGWTAIKLKFLCTLNIDKTSSNIDYVGLENIESNTSRFVSTDIETSGENLKFSKNDILFGKLRPYLAKVWKADFDGCCSSEFFVLTAKDIDPDYLKFVLISPLFIELVNSSTFGAKMPRSNWDFVGDQFIPVPPPGTQKKIASFVAKVTNKIDFVSKTFLNKLELLTAYRQSLITRAVTKGLDPNVEMQDSEVNWIGKTPKHWRKGRFSNLFSLCRGTDLVANDFVAGDYPVYGSGGIIGYHNCFTIEGPTIVIGRSGSVGSVFYETANIWAHNTSIATTDFNGNDPKFAYYAVIALNPKTLASQTAVPTLDRKRILRSQLYIPPLSEQRDIAKYIGRKLDKIDKLSQNLRLTLDKLKEYRSSLISVAVTGKITVN